ncbi:MAG: hypothetical protein ABJB98_06770 [Actinomycetota bacterium]
MLTVLVDADNLAPRRLQPALSLLATVAHLHLVASGRPQALRRVRWPLGSELIESTGWQSADLALAEAYSPSADPLMLISGDGDFALLAARHPGPVLVVSSAPSGRLRDGTTVVDPAIDGVGPIQDWMSAWGVELYVADQPSG